MPRKSIGPFLIEEKIGAGGMGVVYLATYEKTGEKVALKVLAPDIAEDANLLARFEREMEILKKLRHENIVRYFGGGTSKKQPYYAMERVVGGSLEDQQKKKKQFSWEDTVEYGIQICDALQYAHANGVIHRDLKPANLLLEKNGVLKLTDFGIARDTRRTALTAAGKTVGTFDYMAPEQISGKHPISHKTDLYALGCVLFEFLTGQTPFHSENPPETLFKHLDATPPTVRDLVLECPIWLEKLITKLLAKEPKDRPYDALATKVELENVIKKVTERASVTNIRTKKTRGGGQTVAGSIRKRKKKKRVEASEPFWEKSWFLIVALLLVLGFAGWSLMPLSESQLLAKATTYIEKETRESRLYAKEKYLVPLLERFPDGEHLDEVKSLIAYIDMLEEEVRISRRDKMGREPKSEAERLYREALRIEEFGDGVTAKEKYDALVVLMKEKPQFLPVVNLARRQSKELDSEDAGQFNRVQFLNSTLVEADKLYHSGKTKAARKKWNAILTHYSNNKEFKPQVDQATARLGNNFETSIEQQSKEEIKKKETEEKKE